MHRNIKLIFNCLIFLLAFSQCQDDTGTVIRIGIEDYSSAEQKTIGDNLHEFIQKKNTDHIILSRNQNFAPAYDFVEKIFFQAVRTDVVSNIDFFDWSVHILVDDEVRNAFILPGGHLYIYTGLLKYIKSDAELFAVITREIGLADLGAVGRFLGNEHTPSEMGDIFLGNQTGIEIDVIRTLEQRPYQPNVTLEIDNYSIELACTKYNFDDQSIITLINRSANQEIEWFATRPDYLDRIENIELLTAECLTSPPNEAAYKSNLTMHLP